MRHAVYASAQLAEPLPQRLELGAHAVVLLDDGLRARGVVIQLGIDELRLECLDARLSQLDLLLDASGLAFLLLPAGARFTVFTRAIRGRGRRLRRRDSRLGGGR